MKTIVEVKMYLKNNTKVDTKLLYKIIVAAGKHVGAKTGKTEVIVSPGKRASGSARYTNRSWSLVKRGRYVDGLIKLTLPYREDGLDAAKQFYRTALHEWHHIKTWMDGKDCRRPVGEYYYSAVEIAARRAERECNREAEIVDLLIKLAFSIDGRVVIRNRKIGRIDLDI
jgi:hypothetical protein